MKKLTVFLDVDGILCPDYHERFREAPKREEYIRFINWMRNNGFKIVVYTFKKTEWEYQERIKQLNRWGLEYDEIQLKPDYDFIVDDKAVASLDLMKKIIEKMKGEKFYE